MRIVPASDRFRGRPGPFGRRPMDRRDRRAPMGWVPLALTWQKRRKPPVDGLAPVAGAVTQVTNLIQVHPTVVREQMHHAVMRLPSPAGPGTATRSSTGLGRETATSAATWPAAHDHGIVSPGRAVNQPLVLRPLAGAAIGRDGSQPTAAIGRRAPIPDCLHALDWRCRKTDVGHSKCAARIRRIPRTWRHSDPHVTRTT